MDYKKAYNEALERAKKINCDGAYANQGTIVGMIFPELRESEDERIYNEIMEFFKMNEKRCIVDNSYTRWIAWLEKQKEQKPSCWDSPIMTNEMVMEKQKEPEKEELVYRLNGLMQEYIKEGEDENEKEHRFKCYKLFWDALEDASYFEQKEQKPVEWSEEDEAMRNNILRVLNCFVGTSECDSNPSLSTSYPVYQREMDWLKSLPLNLKKKNEDVAKLCSNEWSEEDRDRVAQYLHDRDGGMLWSKATEITNDILDILRPRPSWKPSEEQIYSLGTVVKGYNECTVGSVGYNLKELYEQLKAL